jgi:RNA polymerase sigma-70 factor (ECF subfamily)
MGHAPPTDAELLARFRAGDDDALGPLYARYAGPVFRFLLGVLRDHHQAEDALQETFVQALRKADQIDPATLRGWLFTVAYQQAMLLRRRARRVPAPAEAAALLTLVDERAAAPEAVADRADDLRAVGELLVLLPAAQQAVIRLRVYDGLRFREVAERLGCPVNTALARMHDGLRKLRAMWEARRA